MSFEQMEMYSKIISLVIFFGVFVGVLYWAYRPGNKKRFEEDGRSILNDDEPPPAPSSPPSPSTPAS